MVSFVQFPIYKDKDTAILVETIFWGHLGITQKKFIK